MLKVLRVSHINAYIMLIKQKTVHDIFVLFLSLRLSAPILKQFISLSLMKLLDAYRKEIIN